MNLLIVADTGPLVILAKLNQLELLTKLYHELHIPEAVFNEATLLSQRQDAKRILGFASQFATIDQAIIESIDYGLDEGETQAILLAKQLGSTVLIDERKGRLVAQQEQLDINWVQWVYY